MDKADKMLTEAITSSANSTIGRRVARQGQYNVWWTSEYAAIRRHCQRLYEAACAARTEQTWQLFRDARRQKNRLRRKLKKESDLKAANAVTQAWVQEPGSQNAWRLAKRLRSICTLDAKPSSERLPFVQTQGGGQSNALPDVMQVFEAHYEGLFSGRSAPDSFDAAHYQHVTQTITTWAAGPHAQHEDLDRPITQAEVLEALKLQGDNKAGDHTDIHAELIKSGGAQLVKAIADYFNKVWDSETIPSTWRLSTLVNIFKKGDSGDPGNYRGIALQAILRKAFSTILRQRLQATVPLHESQAGFRSDRSCVDHVYTFARICEAAHKSGTELFAFFLDLKKAYDLVWRDGLFYILLNKNLDGKLVRIIWHMLRDTKCRVRLAGEHSVYFAASLGVGQGDPLSTILFDIFIDHILEELHDSELPDKIPLGDSDNTCIADLAYADDIAALSTSRYGLQSVINKIDCLSNKWRTIPNPTKCKVMIINQHKQHAPFFIRNHAIEQVQSFQYLGVIFSSHGGWEAHARHVISKMNKASAFWKPLLACAHLPTRIRLLMVYTFIYSATMYAGEVWEPTQALSQKIDNIAKAAIRQVLRISVRDCTSEVLFADTGLLPPSALRLAAKLTWRRRISAMDDDRWVKKVSNCKFQGQQRAGRLRSGTEWEKGLSLASEDVQRLLKIKDCFADPNDTGSRCGRATRSATRVLQASARPKNIGNRCQLLDNMHSWVLVKADECRYKGNHSMRASWCIRGLMASPRGRTQYIDVLPPFKARFILAARSGTLCNLDASIASQTQASKTVSHWHSCPHCHSPLECNSTACMHRLLDCRITGIRARKSVWAAIERQARICGINLKDAARMYPGDDARLLQAVLFPGYMKTDAARQYWTTLANAIMQLNDDAEDIHKTLTLQAYDGAGMEDDDQYIPHATFHDHHGHTHIIATQRLTTIASLDPYIRHPLHMQSYTGDSPTTSTTHASPNPYARHASHMHLPEPSGVVNVPAPHGGS